MMEKEAEHCSAHVLEGDGTFNAAVLDEFIKEVKLAECGLSYAVVSIMGPQSSGKSTLLNNLFHTNFKEMDAYKGRSQTTKGIWIAKCVGIKPCTIVMDLEGTDGRERGEDDPAFEKKSALFVLAVSDIVILNMWCHDLGREHAANKPLLRTVFQVMLWLFSPRKTTLLFVIRDKTRTPLEILEADLREDIQKVQVTALSSYEEKEKEFKEQVASLRQMFFRSIEPGGLAGDRRGVVPASGFSFSAQHIWKVIKENKYLDLPAHKVMVATVRCEETSSDIYSSFLTNEEWLEIKEAVQSCLVPGFGKKLSSLLEDCLSSYDEVTIYFEDSVRSAKRKQLEEKLLQLVQPVYQLMLEHIQSVTLENFKDALCDALNGGQGFAMAAHDCTKKFKKLFKEQCDDAAIKQAHWDLSNMRDKFSLNLDSHITKVRTTKLSELTTLYESKLKEALCSPVEALLEKARYNTWRTIRRLVNRETETTVSEFSFALSKFVMDEQEKEDMISKLKNYARAVVEGKARVVAGKVLYLMKDRFTSIFTRNYQRVWTENEDFGAITKSTRSSSLRLLSVLAVIRLDGDTDRIWTTLVHTLKELNNTSQDPLASTTWEDVPAPYTLITPAQCQSLWSRFQRETEYLITQANALQEAYKKTNKPKQPRSPLTTRVARRVGKVGGAFVVIGATGATVCGAVGPIGVVGVIVFGAVRAFGTLLGPAGAAVVALNDRAKKSCSV